MKRFAVIFFLIFLPLFIYGQERHIVVAADGSGEFTSVQEAVNSIRAYMSDTTHMFIKNGIYREKVVIPSWVTNLKMKGESAANTIITWNDHANIRNMGTFRTYTVWIQGAGFSAEDITFENNAEPLGQAVAVHVDGDRAVFRRCRFLGNQDTLLTANQESRQYYEYCYIEGTTDFIFGPATAWFERCQIHSKKNSYITAASTVEGHEFGYIFRGCRLTAGDSIDRVYLGRPWRPYAATIFISCEMGAHIVPEGWHNWDKPSNEETARYGEYGSTGPGASPGTRVKWSHQLSSREAKAITPARIFERNDGWNPGK
ncbi:MAG: pectinesterase family protein [Bacteroidales bacterium]|jgi:pectinesterase|nr:pectinesterase family protein [Bacteroidales bacterium]